MKRTSHNMKHHTLSTLLLALSLWTLCAAAHAYNDAKAFGMKGQVKKVILPTAGNALEEIPFAGASKLTFNEDGSLATIDEKAIDRNKQWTIERNKAGQICKVTNNYAQPVQTMQLVYNTKGYVASITTTLKGKKSSTVRTFIYNTMGHVSRFFKKSGDSSTEFRYVYGETDSHLNWLGRSYISASGKTVTQTRRITYWDEEETAPQPGPTPTPTPTPTPQQEEKTQAGEYLSADLQMRELTGKVKTLRWYDKETESDSRTYGFSQKGQWTTFNGASLSQAFTKVERDAKGRVKSTCEGDNDQITLIEYTYNSAGFVAQQNVDYGMDGYSKETFSYNSQGVLTTSRIVENMGYDAADEPAVTFTYTILERDNQGNWTRRQVKGSDGRNRVEKRVITYWEGTATTSSQSSKPKAQSTTTASIAPGQADLALLQLGGKVSSCQWTDDRGLFFPIYNEPDDGAATTTYKFTQAGRLSSVDDTPALGDGGGSCFFNSHERDAKGRVKNAGAQWSYFAPPYSCYVSWTYDAKGRVQKALHEEAVATVTSTFAYDAQGRLATTTASYAFNYSDYDTQELRDMGITIYKNYTLTISYTYLDADSKGNWTKRTATASNGQKWTETRVIKYWDGITSQQIASTPQTDASSTRNNDGTTLRRVTDCTTYNLKGNVKTVCSEILSMSIGKDGPTPYSRLRFTREGKLLEAYACNGTEYADYASEDVNSNHFITRDTKGRISSYNDQQRAIKSKRMMKMQVVKITYDTNNHVASYTISSPALKTTPFSIYLSYDTEGNVIKSSNGEKVIWEITILETDSHGNWISRKRSDSGWEEKRTITYWDDAADDTKDD